MKAILYAIPLLLLCCCTSNVSDTTYYSSFDLHTMNGVKIENRDTSVIAQAIDSLCRRMSIEGTEQQRGVRVVRTNKAIDLFVEEPTKYHISFKKYDDYWYGTQTYDLSEEHAEELLSVLWCFPRRYDIFIKDGYVCTYRQMIVKDNPGGTKYKDRTIIISSPTKLFHIYLGRVKVNKNTDISTNKEDMLADIMRAMAMLTMEPDNKENVAMEPNGVFIQTAYTFEHMALALQIYGLPRACYTSGDEDAGLLYHFGL